MNTSFNYSSVHFQSLVLFCTTLVILAVPVAFSASTFPTRNSAQNETDEVALKAFKSKIILDPQGVLNSWNNSRHFCDWDGITCSHKHRRVIALDLSSREYGLGNDVSKNGDVYSFGILLLEMVTRKKPTDAMFEGDFNLHSFARMTLPDQVMEIVDPMLINEEMVANNHRIRQALNKNREECLISMVRIGVACSVESPLDRMNISRVVHELQSVKKILLQPTTGFNV
ncbi:hypothetical protein ACOSP7_032351 [Xanthoceras sorbifolium]